MTTRWRFITGQPALRPHGTDQIEVLEPVEFWNGDQVLSVQPGFICDLASIPRGVRSLTRIMGMSWEATARPGIAHDALVRFADLLELKRRQCDGIFYQLLRAVDHSRTDAWLMWAAVRAGGRRAWKRHRETPAEEKQGRILVRG